MKYICKIFIIIYIKICVWLGKSNLFHLNLNFQEFSPKQVPKVNISINSMIIYFRQITNGTQSEPLFFQI